MAAEGEKGYLSILFLCVLMAAALLGVTIWHVTASHVAGSEEYQQETRLRLAAESGLERLARELEKEPELLQGIAKDKWRLYREEQVDGCQLLISAKRNDNQLVGGRREGAIYLQVWAEPLQAWCDGWQRGKLVQGWLYQRGGKCVWQGYRTGQN